MKIKIIDRKSILREFNKIKCATKYPYVSVRVYNGPGLEFRTESGAIENIAIDDRVYGAEFCIRKEGYENLEKYLEIRA